MMIDTSEFPRKSMQTGSFKPSYYNHFFEVDDGYILAYNAFSNSLARIPYNNFEIIKQILSDPDHISCNTNEKLKLKNDLIKGGFLIDSHIDEFDILKVQNLIGRFANKTLSLTIAPTLSCNFKCTYCFESPNSDTMTLEVEDALIKFIDRNIEGKKALNVCWFGGEPLLKIDSIERLTTAFKKLCKEHNVVLSPASIITNGFLLTTEMAERLKKVNIIMAQVTLDGTRDIHDQRRKLVNGKGTFQQIFENTKKVADRLKIVVRINIDKENSDKIESFYEFWRNECLIDKIEYYFGQVRANTGACADIASKCFTTGEYSRLLIDLSIKANQMGISSVRYPYLYKYGFCGADNLNSYVVTPAGWLFKCWADISSEEDESIGNIFEVEQKDFQIMNVARYLNWDPFSKEECIKCKILPICCGGCIYNGLKSLEKKECNFWRYNLKDMLFLKYQEIKKSNKKNGG